jgi:hypothetical protein
MTRYDKFIKPSVTPVVTAGAYSANDVMGGLLEFSLEELSVYGGIVGAVQVTDKGIAAPAGILYLFDSLPATIADNAAFAPSDADAANIFAEITLPAYTSLTNNRIAISQSLNYLFSSDTSKIYGYLPCTGTPTLGSVNALTITLRILSR